MKLLAFAGLVSLLIIWPIEALAGDEVVVKISRVQMDIPVDEEGSVSRAFRDNLEEVTGHRTTLARRVPKAWRYEWNPAAYPKGFKTCDAADPRTGELLSKFWKEWVDEYRTVEFPDGSTISSRHTGERVICTSKFSGTSDPLSGNFERDPSLPEIGTYYNRFEITGGTGRFKGATGTMVGSGDYEVLWEHTATNAKRIEGELRFHLD
jgi:hypothetical protein